jgi:hypothetical protein
VKRLTAALALLAAVGLARGDGDFCRSEYGSYAGTVAVVQTNSLITVVTTPAYGGRTMQYRLADRGFFFENPAAIGQSFAPAWAAKHWGNYGGFKTWLAPQARWGGPPDPALDGAEFDVRVERAGGREAAILLTSPPDRARGVRLSRRLTIYAGSTRVTVAQTLENMGEREVEWSLWGVTQMACGPAGLSAREREMQPGYLLRFPLNPQSKFPGGYRVIDGEAKNPQWPAEKIPGLMTARYLGLPGKIGADSPGGWMAWENQRTGDIYVKRFPYTAGAAYPDEGCSVEVYADGSLPYLEMEVLSPLVKLAPGKTYTFTEDWYAAHCRGPALGVSEVGVVAKRLAANRLGDRVVVTGTFGSFYRGTARLEFLDERGGGVGPPVSLQSGSADPMKELDLTLVLPAPAGATALRLVVAASPGGPALGTLDIASLK